jgi:hypothetical protein
MLSGVGLSRNAEMRCPTGGNAVGWAGWAVDQVLNWPPVEQEISYGMVWRQARMTTTPTPSPYCETITLTLRSPVERLLVEQALVMAQELRAATSAAEPGKVLECCEEAAVAQGQQLTRLALQSAAQEYIEGLEKKLRHCAPAVAAGGGKTKVPTRRRR